MTVKIGTNIHLLNDFKQSGHVIYSL